MDSRPELENIKIGDIKLMDDTEIYKSDEYKARIERAKDSLSALSVYNPQEAINTAAESMAYWQMRAVQAERLLVEEGLIEVTKSNRFT